MANGMVASNSRLKTINNCAIPEYSGVCFAFFGDSFFAHFLCFELKMIIDLAEITPEAVQFW